VFQEEINKENEVYDLQSSGDRKDYCDAVKTKRITKVVGPAQDFPPVFFSENSSRNALSQISKKLGGEWQDHAPKILPS
jgi:hypothetical protein